MEEGPRIIDLKYFHTVPLVGGLGESIILKKGEEIVATVTTVSGHSYLEPRSGIMAPAEEHQEVILKNK